MNRRIFETYVETQLGPALEVGRVTRVGSTVTRYKAGDLVAVGCMVGSDRTCHHCREGLEQFCPNMTLTYNSPDKYLGGVTYGGYSESIVVDERRSGSSYARKAPCSEAAGPSGSGRADGSSWLSFRSRRERPADAAQAAFAAGVWWSIPRAPL